MYNVPLQDRIDQAVEAHKIQEHQNCVIYNDLAFSKEFKGQPIVRREVYGDRCWTANCIPLEGYIGGDLAMPVLMAGSKKAMHGFSRPKYYFAERLFNRWMRRKNLTTMSRHVIEKYMRVFLDAFLEKHYLHSNSLGSLLNYISPQCRDSVTIYLKGKRHHVTKYTPEYYAMRHLHKAYRKFGRLGR